MASNKSRTRDKLNAGKSSKTKDVQTTQKLVVNPGYAYLNQDIPVIPSTSQRTEEEGCLHVSSYLVRDSTNQQTDICSENLTASHDVCNNSNLRYAANQNNSDNGMMVPTPVRQGNSTPRKSATLPHGTKSPKSGQKLSSNSFSGGFLSRLKRKFRLKSKNYELCSDNDANIEGINYHSKHVEDKPRQDCQAELGVAGLCTDSQSTQKKSANYKPLQYMPRGIAGSKVNGEARLSVSNFEKNMHREIDVSLPSGMTYQVMEAENINNIADDPGYESLEDVRRKIRQQQGSQVKEENARGNMNSNQNFFNISSRGYADIGDYSPDNEFDDPKYLGHRRTQSSGFPVCSTDSMPHHNGFLPNTLTSMYATCKDVSLNQQVDDVDNETCKAAQNQSTDNPKFLSPSNLEGMRTKSYPGKTDDIEGSSQELSGHNSDSFLMQCGYYTESDLYANPKIVLRKKSQRKPDNPSPSVDSAEQLNQSHNSDLGSNFGLCHSQQQQLAVQQLPETAPPIPERNYLETSQGAHDLIASKEQKYSDASRLKDSNIKVTRELQKADMNEQVPKQNIQKNKGTLGSMSTAMMESSGDNKMKKKKVEESHLALVKSVISKTNIIKLGKDMNVEDRAETRISDFSVPHEILSAKNSDTSLKHEKLSLKNSDSSLRTEKLSAKNSDSLTRHEKLSPKNSGSSVHHEKLSVKLLESGTKHERLSPKNSNGTKSDVEDGPSLFTPIVQRDDEICLMCQYTRSLHNAAMETTSQLTSSVSTGKPKDLMCHKCFYHKNRCQCYETKSDLDNDLFIPRNGVAKNLEKQTSIVGTTEEQSCTNCGKSLTDCKCGIIKQVGRENNLMYQERAIISGDIRLISIGHDNEPIKWSKTGNDQYTSKMEDFEQNDKTTRSSTKTSPPSNHQDTSLLQNQPSDNSRKSHNSRQVPLIDSLYGSATAALASSVESRQMMHEAGDLDLDLSYCTSDSGCILDESLGSQRVVTDILFVQSNSQSQPIESDSEKSEFENQMKQEKSLNSNNGNYEDDYNNDMNEKLGDCEQSKILTSKDHYKGTNSFFDIDAHNMFIDKFGGGDLGINHFHTSSETLRRGMTTDSELSNVEDTQGSRNPTFYEESAEQVLESLPYTHSDSFADEFGYSSAADLKQMDPFPTVDEPKHYSSSAQEKGSENEPIEGGGNSIFTLESSTWGEINKDKESEYKGYLESLKFGEDKSDDETKCRLKNAEDEKRLKHKSHHSKHRKKTRKSKTDTRLQSSHSQVLQGDSEIGHRSDAAMALNCRLPNFYYHDNEPVHMTMDEIGMNCCENDSYEEPIHMTLDELRNSVSEHQKNRIKFKSKSFNEFNSSERSVDSDNCHHVMQEGKNENEISNPWELNPSHMTAANQRDQQNLQFSSSSNESHQRHHHHHHHHHHCHHHHSHQQKHQNHQTPRPKSMFDVLPSHNQHLNNVYESLDSDHEESSGGDIYELEPCPPCNEMVQGRRGEVLHSAFRDSRLWTEEMQHDLDFLPRGMNHGVLELNSPPDEDFLRRLESRPPAEIPKIHNDKGDASQDFMDSMKQLKDCGWYWGPLSWEEAEVKLLHKPDGSFLVRDSSDDRYILSLSFNMAGRIHHTRIEHHKGKFSFWSQPDSHGKSTIKDFIEQCVKNSRNGQFLYFIRPSGPGSPPLPVHLLYPISRHEQMRSLQHMCRFRILQCIRRDHIDQLPVPKRIREYLKDPQYYVEYL